MLILFQSKRTYTQLCLYIHSQVLVYIVPPTRDEVRQSLIYVGSFLGGAARASARGASLFWVSIAGASTTIIVAFAAVWCGHYSLC